MKNAKWLLGILLVSLAVTIFSSTVYDLIRTGTAKEVMDEITRERIDVNAPDANGVTLLVYALENAREFGTIEALLQAGADVNAQDGKGVTPLMKAIELRLYPIVIETLLRAGADANIRDKEGKTALMVAAMNADNPRVVTALLESGANKELKCKTGETAYDFVLTNDALKNTAILEKLRINYPITEMVTIQGGTFLMGNTRNDSDGKKSEQPVHDVTLAYDYEIGKYEVTFEEFDRYRETAGKSKPDDEGWGRGSMPAVNVSWWDAIAYCNWLSEKEGIAKAYDKDGNLLTKEGSVTADITKVEGYRLPTEAEWEYAARGGAHSKGYKYAGSDTLAIVGWYVQNSGNSWLPDSIDEMDPIFANFNEAHPVGGKNPNELGLYDMSGNVFEWCFDWFGRYLGWSQTNPVGPDKGDERVCRGGSFLFHSVQGRIASRDRALPAEIIDLVGFRLARTVPDSSKAEQNQNIQIAGAYFFDWNLKEIKDTFTGEESGIACVTQLSDWYETSSVYLKWYRPDGTVFHNGERNPFECKPEADGTLYIILGYDFSESENTLEALKQNPGRWKVAVFVDNQYLTALYFTVKPKIKLLYAYTKNWSETEMNDAFTGEESGIACVACFSDWYETHSVYMKWYRPDGTVYYSNESNPFDYEAVDDGINCFTIGYNFTEKENVREILKQNPGRWKVEIYVDNVLEKTLYFTIQDTRSL